MAYAAVALVCYGLALDRGSVTTTAAVTFAVETVVPSAIGLVLLHDQSAPATRSWPPSGSWPPSAAASRWRQRSEPRAEPDEGGSGPGRSSG